MKVSVRHLLAATAVVVLLSAAGCPGDDEPPTDTLSCNDFGSREQAQEAYEQAQTQDDPDPHNLDDDGNGRACEGVDY